MHMYMITIYYIISYNIHIFIYNRISWINDENILWKVQNWLIVFIGLDYDIDGYKCGKATNKPSQFHHEWVAMGFIKTLRHSRLFIGFTPVSYIFDSLGCSKNNSHDNFLGVGGGTLTRPTMQILPKLLEVEPCKFRWLKLSIMQISCLPSPHHHDFW